MNTLKEWRLVCQNTELDLVFPSEQDSVIPHPNLLRQGHHPLLVFIYRPDAEGRRPVYRAQPVFHSDPHWCDLLLFYEYFHADTGQGLGAAHQTGWTGLLANLAMRRYRREVPEYWKEKSAQEVTAWIIRALP